MGENNRNYADSETGTNKRPGRRLWRRLIAVILAAILVLNTVLMVRTKVAFNSADYSGENSEYAAVVTEENTAYLRKSLLERTQSMLGVILHRPKTFEEYEAAAEIAIANEKYGEAVTLLTSCIDQYEGDPSDLARFYLRLGSLYILTEEYEKAVTELSMAIKLNPKESQAYMLRAQMYEELGESARAADDVRAYEKIEGEDPAILTSLGSVYENAAEYDSAIECYTIGIETESAFTPHLYVDRARCHMLKEDRDLEAAMKDLEKYLEIAENDEGGEAAAMLGMCRMQKEDYKGAAKMLRRAIKDGYKEASVIRNQLVMCLYAAEDYEGAVKEGLKGIEAEDSAELEYWTGMAYFAQKQYEDARKHFAEAESMGEAISDLSYNQGVCAMALEQFEEAAEFFTASIKKNENAAASYYNRAICRLSMNDPEAARSDLLEVAGRDDAGDLATEAKGLLEQVFPDEYAKKDAAAEGAQTTEPAGAVSASGDSTGS
ncbi:MAG: tetratricopeptide repeat protein [Lachnospiraceae bacterium]|nr:tetratricopeptide repeat protein [Lachnospiraceae bacterium]